jgi:hypothetical protein
MRSVLFAFLFCLFLGAAQAQYITGKVKSHGDSLPGATVILKVKSCDCRKCNVACSQCCPASVTGVTGPSGMFRVGGGPGVYEVTVEMPGFTTRVLTVTVGDDGDAGEIELTVAGYESITVTEARQSTNVTAQAANAQSSMRVPVRVGTAELKVVDDATGYPMRMTPVLLVRAKSDCAKCPDAISGTTNAKGQYAAKVPAGTYDVIVAKATRDVRAGKVTVKAEKKTKASVHVKEDKDERE